MSDRYFICEQCKKAFPRYNSLVMHYNSTHRGDPHPTRDECMVEELPEGYELRLPREKKVAKEAAIPKEEEGVPPKKESVYREMPEPSNILYRILSRFPGLPESAVTEVMDWVQYRGVLHPMEVNHLLNQLAGVPKGAANIISQKYQLAMQKAAQEGNAELQMTLAGWQYNQPQPGQFGAISPMPGIMGQPSGQYNPYIPWRQPQTGYPQNQPYQPLLYQPPQSEKPNKEIAELREVIEAQQNQIAQLANTLTKTEERKKEDALNARLSQIENAVTAIINRPGTDEGESKSNKELEKLSNEIKGLREERINNQIASLERTISELKEQQSISQQDRIEQLENKLDEYKRLAEKPATGRTEMDVIGSAIDKGMDRLSEAGKDIRAVVTAPQTREQYNPQRKGIEQRRKMGEKIAKKVEDEARRIAKEDTFMSSEPIVS